MIKKKKSWNADNQILKTSSAGKSANETLTLEAQSIITLIF